MARSQPWAGSAGPTGITEAAAGQAEPSRLGYMPALDGLRANAIVPPFVVLVAARQPQALMPWSPATVGAVRARRCAAVSEKLFSCLGPGVRRSTARAPG